LTFWIVVAVIYIILGAVTWFIGSEWQNSSVFTEVFGSAATSTGFTGGGGAGGGGGSW